MKLLLPTLIDQIDFNTGVEVLLDTPEFSFYGDVIHAANELSQKSLDQMEILNMILDTKDFELSVYEIPENLKAVLNVMLEKNQLELYRSCPLTRNRNVNYPSITFPTPLVASFISKRKTSILGDVIIGIKQQEKKKIEESQREAAVKVQNAQKNLGR